MSSKSTSALSMKVYLHKVSSAFSVGRPSRTEDLGHSSKYRGPTRSQTCPSVQTVHLFGSWDNFSCHTMEPDFKRGRGQWRGCHEFKNIVCDGDQVSNPGRDGGLKMGQTYYYYYELDGSTETHDPAHPTTNACPFLPGQTVNTLEVPTERSMRFRSASMNSLRSANFKTMNPKDKFTTPRPAPPAPGASEVQVGSLPSTSFSDTRPARSPSPGPAPTPKWAGAARRLFGLKHCGRDDDRGRTSRGSDSGHTSPEPGRTHDRARSTTPSGSIRSRDMSPESFRRFLSDDVPVGQTIVDPSPKLWIPDEIVEENEDDDNFATSAVSESAPVTMLSPPPAQHTTPSSLLPRSKNASTATIVPEGAQIDAAAAPAPVGPRVTTFDIAVNIPRSHFSFSTTSSSPVSPISRSTNSRDRSNYSFLDESEGEDYDDYVSSNEDDFRSQPAESKGSEMRAPFANYSLPYHNLDSGKHADDQRRPTFGSPELIARNDNGMPVGNTHLLSLPHIDSGLDDLANEISWIADVIRPKDF